MFPSRVRLRLRRGVQSAANDGILPRGLTPHASSSPCRGGAAQRSYHHQQLQQQQEDDWEESKAVKVTVWWDFQRCRLPSRVKPRFLVPRLTAALRGAGIRGPVDITAFGDVTRIPTADRQALADTGVSLSHLPDSGEGSVYQSFVPDLVSWIAQNPPPAHFLLISADEGFAKVLHRLRMSNYNVLLSSPNDGSKMMHSAATLMWPWEPLVNGVDIVPKYVNPPPDGLSSWYGQYRGGGDDLLLKPKKSMALQRNTKEPKVPKSVITGIKRVLQLYPEGVGISDLQVELERINVFIDEGFFGFKKFSVLLKAMPDVVKLIDPLPGETQPAVVEVFKSSVEFSAQSSFNRMDSAQSSTEGKHHNQSESEELSWLDDQPSSSGLTSCTEKKTLETEALLPPLEQSSRGQRKAPGSTQRAERPSKHVEADVPLAGDAPSIDQRNAAVADLAKKTEQPVNRTEADKVDASGTPSSSGAQGSTSNKRGLFEHISSLWNGRSA